VAAEIRAAYVPRNGAPEPTKPILFTQASPCEYVLLVAKTVDSGGFFSKATRASPSGTEVATREHLLAAGYIPVEQAVEAIRRLVVDSGKYAKAEGAVIMAAVDEAVACFTGVPQAGDAGKQA